ncbi:unnamed protein product [Didymodactylos carnosus]|uniref:HAT C-terminal dimerisation domain-containing protein n=1 Tax=Didymodactylos carnosus TaxID=1234261 RepID=A0A8S2HNV8_9BILA|nr:unnamed protein product [Didymodactylos carnosus]CAF3667586.1 unnamed protein product [Didymodactylos carnosus]
MLNVVSHMSLSEKEKQQFEREIKTMIFNDVYANDASTITTAPTLTTTSTTTTTQQQQLQQFNLKIKSSTTSAIECWKINQSHLSVLSHLAKIHLAAFGTSVPSESAYLGRKERARLSTENLLFSVFLKDKIVSQ